MTIFEISELLGNFGEFFGAIAVVATLIYLARQIHQQNGVARYTVWQTLQRENISLNSVFIHDMSKDAVFQKGLEAPQDLSDLEASLFGLVLRNNFNVALMAWNAYREGIFSADDWQNMARWGAHDFFATPGGSQWRELVADVFSEFWQELSKLQSDGVYGDMSFGRGSR